MFIPVRLCRNSCMSVIPILAITTDIHYSVQIDSDVLWFKLFLISHAWMHHNMFGIKWKQIKYPKWWAQYHYSCFFFDENKFLRNRVSFILGRTVSYVNDASWKKNKEGSTYRPANGMRTYRLTNGIWEQIRWKLILFYNFGLEIAWNRNSSKIRAFLEIVTIHQNTEELNNLVLNWPRFLSISQLNFWILVKLYGTEKKNL